MLLKRLIILPFMCAFCSILFGQHLCSKWTVGFDFDLLNPVRALDTNGYGVNYGVNVDVFYLGFEKNRISFYPGLRFRGGKTESNAMNEYFVEPINEEGIRTIYNAAWDGKFVVRVVSSHIYRMQPYVEVDMGVRLASGNEQINTFPENEQEALDYTEFVTKGVSGSYGFGAGFLLVLSKRIDLNLRANFDVTNHMKHFDLTTDFPFEETKTNNSINQRFAIGLLVHIGCEDTHETLEE